DPQGNGERGADQGHDDDAVIILNLGFHFVVHLVLHLSLHTGIATASKRTANFNAVHRPYDQTPRPIGAKSSVSFEPACNFATERKHGFRRLSLEGVAEGIVADGSDGSGQGPRGALRFDLQPT